jgi:hypothetical protein
MKPTKAKLNSKHRAIIALLRDDLFADSKDWRESDEVGRVDWLISMYERARDEKNMVWEWHGRELDALREIAESTTADADAVREIAHKALSMGEEK